MTVEQRKISLINWITNLNDEAAINQIQGFRKTSIEVLPKEIIELLRVSDSENLDECVEHTNSRDVLNLR